MVYPVEELRQIHIDRKAAALLDEALYLFHRLLPVSMGPEPETVIREAGVENGQQAVKQVQRLISKAAALRSMWI
jgi:hypothetical protein